MSWASKSHALRIIYRRFVDHHNQTSWQSWTKLKSNDYDYDRYDNGYKTHHLHEQQFGISLRSHGRLLLVGAPYADYGNQGNRTIREHYDTDGLYNVGLGRGKAYVFYSSPIILRVSFHSNAPPINGHFKLSFNLGRGPVITELIPHNADTNIMKEKLESLVYVGDVNIQTSSRFDNQTSLYTFDWVIVFLTIFEEEISLLPLWKHNGCGECDEIEGTNGTYINPNIEIETISKVGRFRQEWAFQGDDVTSGDRFGYNIDLDGSEAIVGAMYSSAKTRTTWDFETGTLIGWVANGDAFDYQPVFGDNSNQRIVYEGFGKPDSQTSGFPQSALIQGRYYIGTFEKRPGKMSDYLSPDENFSEGSIQGDLPTGTLTSDPFIILGDKISFLIGGGCDHMTEYVELLVDGFVTVRATGQCNERMERIEWYVNSFKHRSAQIRIVDAASGEWGHINVDHITFSWKSIGGNSGCSNSGGVLPKKDGFSKQHYSGKEESALSGAAYIFVRNCSAVDWIKAQEGIGCTWEQNARLTPSDKRSGNLFGSSVSIDSSEGIAIVGSVHAPLYGMYKEFPSLYPHNDPKIRFPIDQNLEHFMKSDGTLSPTAGNLRVTNYIFEQNRAASDFLSKKFSEKAGAGYIYKRTRSITDSNALLLRAPFWQSFEHAKITPPELSGNDLFGNNVKIVGDTVFATAIGDKSCCGNGSGAAFVFDTKWHNVQFSEVEYEAIEGIHDKVSISVIRDESSIDKTIVIGYSTSDLSAVGVDKNKVQTCLHLPINERNGCGDYEHTSGILTFKPGMPSINFEVKIIDDDSCWERHMKYIQLNLHIPGGSLIQGENFRAQLKIDDDDWLGKDTTKLCSTGTS